MSCCEEGGLLGGRVARGASSYGRQCRFSPTWAPHPAACKVVRPLALEMGQRPVCPLRAPPAASRREQVRPEDGGAAPDCRDLVPPSGAARSPRTDRYPDRGPHRQMEKPRRRAWEGGASQAQRSLVPTPTRLPPGHICTLGEAHSVQADPLPALLRQRHIREMKTYLENDVQEE